VILLNEFVEDVINGESGHRVQDTPYPAVPARKHQVVHRRCSTQSRVSGGLGDTGMTGKFALFVLRGTNVTEGGTIFNAFRQQQTCVST
jgi:hypothetical protein